MSTTINHLIARGNMLLATRQQDSTDSSSGSDATGESNDNVMNLMIGFLGIIFFGLVLVALLIMLRRARQQRMMQQSTLPMYNDVTREDNRNPHHLTIQTADGRQSILVLNGRPMLADPNQPPHSPRNIPEIHITFPDEQDESGHCKSGRVMVVRVGETTVGLEPVREEQLPAYEKESSHSFYSIDMDQIGGLKEKEYR
jgi:preprotein translocase subunit SecG